LPEHILWHCERAVGSVEKRRARVRNIQGKGWSMVMGREGKEEEGGRKMNRINAMKGV
jgi:hypothetical protein